MLNNIKSSTQAPAYFLTCKYIFIFDVLVLDLHQANFVVLQPDEININQYPSHFLHNSQCIALHLLENKKFHICPVFENLHRSWPLYSCFITLVSSLPIPNDYSVSLYYLITRARKMCEGNHSQMCTSDRALGARLGGVSCRAEAIDAACLLPIFKFSAPCGTRSVTSSKPLLGLTLCSLLKPKKQTSWSNSLFFQQGGVVNNEIVLQTASHEYKPPWQQKASALLRCPCISESLPAVMAVTGGHSANK